MGSSVYGGSRLLEPLVSVAGLPLDQVNFLAAMFLSILLGYPYRKLLGPDKVSVNTRHYVEIGLGIWLSFFCFGTQIWHIAVQSVICYVLMATTETRSMPKIVFAASLGYLCIGHVYRLIYDYGGYTLDITGPLMINTQRLSSLAFSLADGSTSKEISGMLRKHRVTKFPSVLQFVSYIFSFHGIICGPFAFYNEYMEFIDGSNYTQHPLVANGVDKKPVKTSTPSPVTAVLIKIGECILLAFITLSILPKFPISYLTDSEYHSSSFLFRLLYPIIATTIIRQRYYLGWKLAEASNVSSGFGFNGYDSSGHALWDKLDNALAVNVEVSTNLKVLLDNWNVRTSQWLRHVVYERLHSTMAVFVFSAFWHGFYGGYYLTFVTAGLFISAARVVRRRVRPLFQSSRPLARFYDILTILSTRVLLGYLAFPFVLLEFWAAIRVYSDMYFFLHIAAILTIVADMFLPKPSTDGAAKKTK